MASMFREALPRKGLLQVRRAACFAPVGGMSARRRGGRRRWTLWGCVGLSRGPRRGRGRGRGMGRGRLLRLELAAPATRVRRGRRR